MAIGPLEVGSKQAQQTVFVDTFTDGLLGPEVAMLGPVADGGHVVWNSAPGCWGPMITPSIRGGHEVSQPVAVAGAEVGGRGRDPDQAHRGHLDGDRIGNRAHHGDSLQRRPLLRTRVSGVSDRVARDPDSWDRAASDPLRALRRGRDAFTIANGYTMAFDELRSSTLPPTTDTGGRL